MLLNQETLAPPGGGPPPDLVAPLLSNLTQARVRQLAFWRRWPTDERLAPRSPAPDERRPWPRGRTRAGAFQIVKLLDEAPAKGRLVLFCCELGDVGPQRLYLGSPTFRRWLA